MEADGIHSNVLIGSFLEQLLLIVGACCHNQFRDDWSYIIQVIHDNSRIH